MEQAQTIRSVQRAIDVLQVVGAHDDGLTLTEISNETKLAKSTVTRVLATLEVNNYIQKEESTGKYYLGVQLYFLGHAASKSLSLNNVAKDTMLAFREEIGETVNLYIADGYYRVCVQQYESLHSVKHMIQVGQQLPMTVGASGKVLLAYKDNAFIEEVMQKQPMVKSKEALKEELAHIKSIQYAESIEEREVGTSAAAAPIFDIDGKMIGALSVSGPAQRFNPQKVEGLKERLIEKAYEISSNMGYRS